MRCSVRVLYAFIGFLPSGRALGHKQRIMGCKSNHFPRVISNVPLPKYRQRSSSVSPNMIADVMDEFMDEHHF